MTRARRICLMAIVANMMAASAPVQAQSPSAVSDQDPGQRGIEQTGRLQAGANSYSEGQARGLLEKKGFENVSALVNDPTGIWHGKARKDGRDVNVSIDYRGTIVAQ